MLTIGSLFDGIGVFPLAAIRHGITPVWASEIEKAPISITQRHFSEMKHLGSITELNGRTIPPVDIITFGSPCQDLSLAGNRAGLTGSRSGLFHHAIRIIEEMRCYTNGCFPAIAVWENVMGAFSSNNRMDFRAVLSAFTGGSKISMPASNSWANAGMVRGYAVDIAWRVLDAQHWGEPRLPQRRKRIFTVADFRAERAAEILFKPRSLHPDSALVLPNRVLATQHRILAPKTGRPILRPWQERKMRGTAANGDFKGFERSFGRANEPFPTLMTRDATCFSYWLDDDYQNGFLRRLTPLECERLMGLPDEWTAYGKEGPVSDLARYKAIGNSIAVPCAEYIMKGIAEVLEC